MVLRTSLLVLACIGLMHNSDGRDVMAPEGELRRVMEHQHEHVTGGDSLLRSLKMSAQNLCFADPVIGEKSIGCFRVGPILASPGNAPADFLRELLKQLAQPLAVARIPERALRQLILDPPAGLQIGGSPRLRIARLPFLVHDGSSPL